MGKDLDQYKSVCHHGTGYTNIVSDYDNIHTESLYYVPLNKTYEVWRMKIRNDGPAARKLALFGFAEFTNDNNYEQDTVNLQYTLFISRTYYKNNKILQVINENIQESRAGDSSALPVRRLPVTTETETRSWVITTVTGIRSPWRTVNARTR